MYSGSFIIENPKGWEIYIDEYSNSVLKLYKFSLERHFGIPLEFPCIVFSNLDQTHKFVEHNFVYINQALDLIKIDKESNCRLARVISGMEEK